MLSVVMEILGAVGTAAVVSVTSSWKFTLGYLAVVPVLVVTHALRLKTFRSRTKEEQKALGEAGQVRIYQVFEEQCVLYTIWDPRFPHFDGYPQLQHYVLSQFAKDQMLLRKLWS